MIFRRNQPKVDSDRAGIWIQTEGLDPYCCEMSTKYVQTEGLHIFGANSTCEQEYAHRPKVCVHIAAIRIMWTK